MQIETNCDLTGSIQFENPNGRQPGGLACGLAIALLLSSAMSYKTGNSAQDGDTSTEHKSIDSIDSTGPDPGLT